MLNVRFKALAATTALLACGAVQAQLGMPQSKNSSLLFTAIDAEGTPAAVMIDLAYVLTDFDTRGDVTGVLDGSGTPGPRGALLAEGTTAVWNFRNNTLTVNGAAVAGDYRWSTQFDLFASNAQAAQTRFGVFAMSTGGYPEFFLTSGNPTAQDLATQTPGMTNNLGALGAWYGKIQTRGAFNIAGQSNDPQRPAGPVKASYAMVDNTSDLQGWPLGGGNVGVNGNWATNLRWSALVAEGTASQMHFLEAGDLQYKDNLGGTFSYSDGVLTWQAAQPIPEPGAWLLAALGGFVLLHWKRRRNAATPANAGRAVLPSAQAASGLGGGAFTAAA